MPQHPPPPPTPPRQAIVVGSPRPRPGSLQPLPPLPESPPSSPTDKSTKPAEMSSKKGVRVGRPPTGRRRSGGRVKGGRWVGVPVSVLPSCARAVRGMPRPRTPPHPAPPRPAPRRLCLPQPNVAAARAYAGCCGGCRRRVQARLTPPVRPSPPRPREELSFLYGGPWLHVQAHATLWWGPYLRVCCWCTAWAELQPPPPPPYTPTSHIAAAALQSLAQVSAGLAAATAQIEAVFSEQVWWLVLPPDDVGTRFTTCRAAPRCMPAVARPCVAPLKHPSALPPLCPAAARVDAGRDEDCVCSGEGSVRV
jgi:hypothetical protein